eukprot:1914654-Amphidinium_carterae.1
MLESEALIAFARVKQQAHEAANRHEAELVRRVHMIQQQLHAKDQDRVQDMERVRRKYAERAANLETQGNQLRQ